MSKQDKLQFASNRKTTSPGEFRELAQDFDPAVRSHVANNHSTPEDVLRELAKDKNQWVRMHVTQNPKSSRNLLVLMFEYEKSLKEPSRWVIDSLYDNPKLPHIAKVIIGTLFGEMLS